MIILGIDPGTARMGYGVLEISQKNKTNLIKSGVLITTPDCEAHHRLLSLFKELNALVKEFAPEIMVLERLFFNTNAKTALTVGQARGVSMLVAARNGMNLFEYTALQAKLVLTGYGRSDKKQMQEAVKNNLKLAEIIKSDDANDAVAMALCYFIKEHESRNNNKH